VPLFFKVCGDAGRAESVIADPDLDAGVRGAALNHRVGVLLPHGVAGKRTGFAGRRAKQRSLLVCPDASDGDVLVEVEF
jgi:hypothetical protein